jgi:hypothetical protein
MHILREIVIPPSIRAIEERAFYGCSELAIVILGEGLKEIGEAAFARCTSLREIVIPPAVRVIHEGAFKHGGHSTGARS